MKWFLVSFMRDWADEFYVHGMAIFSDREWNDYQIRMKTEDSISMQFGSNEGWENESGKEYLECMTATEITEEEAKFLHRCFDDFYNWGHFPTLDNFDLDKEEDYPFDIEKILM